MREEFLAYIHHLQDHICKVFEDIDCKANFYQDLWERKEGGGGRTRVMENGGVFEKCGVNISYVHGVLPEALRKNFKVKQADFFACGLSLVAHPMSPMIPTVHANWRYFEMYDSRGKVKDAWFGGGQDLTPYYLFDNDVKHFHTICKTVCDIYGKDLYPKYKKACDEYFWNSHRNEARGVGGLFFDYLKQTKITSLKKWYDLISHLGNSFLESYLPIVESRKNLKYTPENRKWQEIRRGRYAEFNLLHDKGTLFGLKTSGRIESIFMSLPPKVQWHYNYTPDRESPEALLLEVLAHPKSWI